MIINMPELTKEQQKQVEKEIKQEVKEQTKQIEQKIEEKFSKKLLKASKSTASFFGSEFKKQTSLALMAAFGFLVALAWRDLITKVVNENIPTHLLEAYPYLNQLYTAVIITFIAAIAIALISRWANKEEEK